MIKNNYKKLIVWRKSMVLVRETYLLTNKFPKEELYGLTSQVRRSVVSIPSNIAEGSLRGSNKEFNRFLSISFGSGGELETQLEIAKMLQYAEVDDYISVESLLVEVMKMLNTIINKA